MGADVQGVADVNDAAWQTFPSSVIYVRSPSLRTGRNDLWRGLAQAGLFPAGDPDQLPQQSGRLLRFPIYLNRALAHLAT